MRQHYTNMNIWTRRINCSKYNNYARSIMQMFELQARHKLIVDINAIFTPATAPDANTSGLVFLQSNTTSRANTQISTATATSFRGQLIDEEMKNKYRKKTLLSTHFVLNKPVTGNVWCLSYYSM